MMCSVGSVSCTGEYRLALRARLKSPDTIVSIPTELSDAPDLAMLHEFCGRRQVLPRNLRLSPDRASARLSDGLAEKSRRLLKSSKPHYTKRSNGSPS